MSEAPSPSVGPGTARPSAAEGVPLPVRLLDLFPLALAAIVGGRVLWAFSQRFDHPFDLEWMEGGMLAHAWRIQQGLPLYLQPNPDFIPYIYPPGFSALLAALSPSGGLDYPLGRVLSILGSIAAAAAIPFVTVRHARDWVSGLCGAALFLGTFRASGGFMDLVRPDALAVGLLAWSVALALERFRGAEIASGLLLFGAFLFKHNFAAFGVPLALGLALRGDLVVAGRFVVASAGPGLLATLALQAGTGGHFLTYLLSVPRSHPMDWSRLALGMPGEVGRWLMPAMWASAGWAAYRAGVGRSRLAAGVVAAVAVALAAAAAAAPAVRGVDTGGSAVVAAAVLAIGIGLGAVGFVLAHAVQTRGAPRARPDWRWGVGVGVVLLAVLLGGLMRAHFGGFINVLMPLHWALAAALAASAAHARLHLPRAHPGAGPAVFGVTMLLWVAQLGWVQRRLEIDPVVPTPALVEAGRAVEAALREHCPPEGRILAPQFAWLPTRLGRPPSMPLISLWDLNHRRGPYFPDAKEMMRAAVREHHWTCVIEGGARHEIGFGVHEAYEPVHRLGMPARELGPLTGWRVKPRTILVPTTTTAVE